MDMEGGNKEKLKTCRKWISLHFLFIFSFFLHFLAARLPQLVQPCQSVSWSPPLVTKSICHEKSSLPVSWNPALVTKSVCYEKSYQFHISCSLPTSQRQDGKTKVITGDFVKKPNQQDWAGTLGDLLPLLIFLHLVLESMNNSFPRNTFNPPVHFVLSMSREPVLQVHLHKYILISTKRQRCFKHLWLCLSCSQGFAGCLSKPRKFPTCVLNSCLVYCCCNHSSYYSIDRGKADLTHNLPARAALQFMTEATSMTKDFFTFSKPTDDLFTFSELINSFISQDLRPRWWQEREPWGDEGNCWESFSPHRWKQERG